MIRIKRAYDPATADDGVRVLVDRLWPRGVSKERLDIAAWDKDVAPSTALREWFHHSEELWSEFRKRYVEELAANPQAWAGLLDHARAGTLTLVYAAKDEAENNAVVLQEFLNARLNADQPS